MTFKDLFGDKLVNQAGKTVDPDELSKADGVLVYFSAHWCPPCRGFTPQLVKTVNKMKADKKKVEAVFVSSDSDESSYKGYFGEMTGFLSLPYVDRERKAKLSSMYKVAGIPTLIVLNNKAEVITKNGREAVMRDVEGKNFPWIPRPFKDVLGSKFLSKSANAKDVSEISADVLKGKTIGIYFSAHWCGPCRQFTPELIKTYNTLVADKKPFEIIFVSGDRSEEDFKNYYSSMPWAAVPFKDESRRDDLNALFEVEGIPTFVIVDYDSGKTVQKEGRMAIAMDPQGKNFPWTPKPVNELNRATAASLNDTAALIAFLPSDATADDEKKVFGALEPLAKDALAANDDISFFVAKKDPLVPRVKGLFGSHKGAWLVGILDIPSGGAFINESITKTTEITDASIRAFYKSYKAGSLKAKPLSQGGDDDDEEESAEGS